MKPNPAIPRIRPPTSNIRKKEQRGEAGANGESEGLAIWSSVKEGLYGRIKKELVDGYKNLNAFSEGTKSRVKLSEKQKEAFMGVSIRKKLDQTIDERQIVQKMDRFRETYQNSKQTLDHMYRFNNF